MLYSQLAIVSSLLLSSAYAAPTPVTDGKRTVDDDSLWTRNPVVDDDSLWTKRDAKVNDDSYWTKRDAKVDDDSYWTKRNPEVDVEARK